MTLAEHQTLLSKVLMAKTVLSSIASATEVTADLSAMPVTLANSNSDSATVYASLARTNLSTLTTPTEVFTFQSALTNALVVSTPLKSTLTARMLSTQ